MTHYYRIPVSLSGCVLPYSPALPARIEYYAGPTSQAKKAAPNPVPPSRQALIEEQYRLKGIILLQDIKRVSIADKGKTLDVQEAKAKKGKRLPRFPLHVHMKDHVGRLYLLKAFSADERETFKTRLQEAVERDQNVVRGSSWSVVSGGASSLNSDGGSGPVSQREIVVNLRREDVALARIHEELQGTAWDDAEGWADLAAKRGVLEEALASATAALQQEEVAEASGPDEALQLVPCFGLHRKGMSVAQIRLPENGLRGAFPDAILGLVRAKPFASRSPLLGSVCPCLCVLHGSLDGPHLWLAGL